MEYSDYLKLANKYACFSLFYESEPDFFKSSCYPYVEFDDLTSDEITYLDLLSKTFNVSSPQGTLVPYIPFGWQIDYHRASINIRGEGCENIFVEKSRGISYSTSSLIEAIMTANMYEGTSVPIISKRYEDAAKLVRYARWLVKNANAKIPYNEDKVAELELIFKNGNTSSLLPFPAGTIDAVDAIRGLLPRPVRLFIDEAAYIRYLEELLGAAENTMQSKETQVVIGSTFKGVNNKYYKMSRDELSGYRKIIVPGFSENLNPELSLSSQNITPTVWWYNISKIDAVRFNSKAYFMQEYQLSPVSDTDAYIDYSLIECAANLDKYIFDKSYLLVGVDVALENDYAVIIVVRTDGFFYEVVDLWYDRKVNVEVLENKIRHYCDTAEEIRIDATGQGLPVYQRLSNEFGAKIKGINFRGVIKIPGKVNQPVRNYMAGNLLNKFMTTKLKIPNDDLLKSHLLSVKKDLSATRNKDGHSDGFWSLALAVLPLGYEYGGFSEQQIPQESTNTLQDRIADLMNNRKLGGSGFGWRRI